MSKAHSNRCDKGISRGNPIVFYVDGQEVPAYEGETVASAMIAAGLRVSRFTYEKSHGRGYYCGMGVCWECIMVVDGRRSVRVCKLLVRPNMSVKTQHDGENFIHG